MSVKKCVLKLEKAGLEKFNMKIKMFFLLGIPNVPIGEQKADNHKNI